MISYTPYLTAILALLVYFLWGQIKERRRKTAMMRKRAERELDKLRLAQGLLVLASVFIQRGQYQDALPMLEMSVHIYRQQPAERAAELRRELADSLSTMAVSLSTMAVSLFCLERYQEALLPVDEAIAITGALAEHDHETFQSQLAKNVALRQHILENENGHGSGFT